jgi:GNAT superfamily N-acetyltransferase
LKPKTAHASRSDATRRFALVVEPVTPERWSDLEQLFGPRGACAGCWCMYWCTSAARYREQKGEGNKRALHARVRVGDVPGLIGYVAGEPVAWCAVEPRERYPRLAGSRILKPVDARAVWSVSCLYVRADHRRRGLTTQMIEAAVRHARDHGATLIEGYPHDPGDERMGASFAWTGFATAFRAAGFEEVARRSPKRPIMRRELRRRTRAG